MSANSLMSTKINFVRHVALHSLGHSYPFSAKFTCIVQPKPFLSESQNCSKYFLFKTLCLNVLLNS